MFLFFFFTISMEKGWYGVEEDDHFDFFENRKRLGGEILCESDWNEGWNVLNNAPWNFWNCYGENATFFFSLSLHEEHFDSFLRTNRYFSFFCFHIDGRSSRRSRSGILANKNRIGDGDEILCRVKQRVREFIQEGKKGRFPFLGRRAIEDCIHGGGGLKRVLITIERRRRKIRKKGTKSLRTSAICTLERLLLPFLPCEGMEGKSKWKPRGRACSNCSTGPRQGLKLEEGETSGDSCIHEFRHWQITLTIRIPRIVRGLIRDVCVHPLPLIATSDYNGTVATWR